MGAYLFLANVVVVALVLLFLVVGLIRVGLIKVVPPRPPCMYLHSREWPAACLCSNYLIAIAIRLSCQATCAPGHHYGHAKLA